MNVVRAGAPVVAGVDGASLVFPRVVGYRAGRGSTGRPAPGR